MSLKTLIDIAGMPGMDLAVTAAVELGTAVHNIKVYRTQCRDLSDRCSKLLLAFRERCQGLEGSEFMAAADEVSCIIERAHRKALTWASWNRIKSLVNQGEIKLGLEQLYRDIDLCAQHFNIASSAELHRSQRELQVIHERDVADNREILQNILQSVDGLRDVLNEPSSVRPIMQTIQEELQQQHVQPEQSRELQQSLYEIHRKTQFLPPMIDLTGQVEKTSKAPSAYGAYNDVYTGLWLGEEKVALKFARAINHTAKARKRFHKEVEIWRDLQHPHVSRLYGIYYEEDQIYSVSPWMECGSALDYINSTDEVINRLGILGDVASGMEYLHKRGVVHGDLRAANVLIGNDGRACVSDFGLSQVIEEVAPDMSSTIHGDSPVRWQAPELVQPDDYDGSVSVSPPTDVWSFGMLCLEILAGKKPYHNRLRDASVVADLVSRRLPERPTDEAVVLHGLSDQMWNLMQHCWNWEPTERPSMATIKVGVRSLPLPAPSSISNVILANSLSESPKPITKDLPQVTNRSTAIPLPSHASLSPGLGMPHRSSLLSSTPPLGSTPPRAIILSTSPSGAALKHYSPSQSSSGSSTNFTGPRPPGSGPSIRHRLSTSSVSGQSSQNVPTSPPMACKTLGVSPPKTPQSILHNPPVTGLAVRQYSSPRSETRGPSFSTVHSNGGVSPPSGISLTNPLYASANDLLNGPSRNRGPSPSTLSLTNPSRVGDISDSHRRGMSPPPSAISLANASCTRGLSNVPPRVNAESIDEDAILTSFFGSDEFTLKHMRSVPQDIEVHNPLPYGSALQSPPFRSSEERSEDEPSGGSVSSSFPSSVDSPFTHDQSSSISDTAPLRSALLDFGNLNLSTYIRYNKDGSVKAASLRGLIDRLLKESIDGYVREQKFQDTFLATHRLFASTTDVLKFLLYHYTVTILDQNMPVEERVVTRFKVLKNLSQWLKGHYARALELRHLEDLRLFLQDITSPPAFFNSARELINAIDSLVATHPSRAASPTLSHTGSRRSVRASEISPTGLAIALSVLEGGKFKAISAMDCISYLLHKDDPAGSASVNKVTEARATNNKIVNWVKKSILRSDKMDNRGDTLRFFINTAAECHKLNNYSSMSALLAGIESPIIMRLKLTRGCLDKHIRETQKRLSSLLEINHNHRAYREAIRDLYNTPCLPYLAVHLKDLQVIYDRHPNHVQFGEQSLINFEKFVHIHDNVLAILAFQEQVNGNFSNDGERKAGPLLYLEEQLAMTQLGQVAENRMEMRSLELQKQEDRDYEHRVNELAAVGFRTSRGGRS